jgi:hypothetical protein
MIDSDLADIPRALLPAFTLSFASASIPLNHPLLAQFDHRPLDSCSPYEPTNHTVLRPGHLYDDFFFSSWRSSLTGSVPLSHALRRVDRAVSALREGETTTSLLDFVNKSSK